MCDRILVTLLKMELHYSQSSRENATPSSSTSPLASYKEVPPVTTAPLNIFATTFTKYHLAFRQPTSKLLEGWVGKKPSSTTPTPSAYLQLARFQTVLQIKILRKSSFGHYSRLSLNGHLCNSDTHSWSLPFFTPFQFHSL